MKRNDGSTKRRAGSTNVLRDFSLSNDDNSALTKSTRDARS